MTDPNKAFRDSKNPPEKLVDIVCLECGYETVVKNSVWWDESIEIECFECGNLFEWELAQ